MKTITNWIVAGLLFIVMHLSVAAQSEFYTSPVVFHNDTLFEIYSPQSQLNADDRSRAITGRLEKIYIDGTFDASKLSLVKNEPVLEIVYENNDVIMVISEYDARFASATQQQLADKYLNKIASVLSYETRQHSIEYMAMRILKVAGVVITLLLIIYLLNKLTRKITLSIYNNRKRWASGIKVGANELLSPKKQVLLLLRIIKLLRLAIIIIAVYASLPLLFAIFPETKQITGTLLEWTLRPAKQILKSVWDYLPNVFTILLIWFIMRYIIRLVKYVSSEVESGKIVLTGFHPDWAKPTFNIIRFLLYAFTLIIVFPYLPGSGSPAFQGVSVFLGVLLSLGSSSAITNIIAGLVITYMRPFKIGDRIKVGENSGDVIEKTMLVTRIRTVKNESITIPNSSILSGSVINYSAYSKNEGLILHTTVTIGYDVPWKKVEQALLEAASRTKKVKLNPSPFVLQLSLDDFSVAYQLNVFTEYANNIQSVRSDLHSHIQDVCNEHGIEIMSPTYTAIRDGNKTTIPESYLPNDYSAPHYRVDIKK
jgi:small-conductance mechanosensitive channel